MRGLFVAILAAVFLTVTMDFTPTWAVISGCSASVTPTTVRTSTTRDFTFNVKNNDSSNVVNWVKITSAGTGNLNINSGSASGWTADLQSAGEIVFSGGSIAAGASTNFTVNITSGSSVADPEEFGVQVSDAGGASPRECSGAPSITISNIPIISNIAVSDLTSSSAKISWTTDVNSDSVVRYGLTSAYGSTKSDSALVTSHSLTLDGLSADTTYHYQVRSTDSSGNTASSQNNTFLTKSAPAPAPAEEPKKEEPKKEEPKKEEPKKEEPKKEEKPTPTPEAAPQPEITIQPGKEVTPPKISISSDLSKPFKEAPVIEGKASDNDALAKIEYSTDNGRNWLPVDSARGLGSKETSFSFQPKNLKDGNYSLIARAIDAAGNRTPSAVHILIIDMLPPVVGGNITTNGPALLQPNPDGVIVSTVGVDQKITLNALGGPIGMTIVAQKKEGAEQSLFNLTKSPASDLWSGILAFTDSGLYSLTVEARDGADNVISQRINPVFVLDSGQIVDKKGKAVSGAKVSLYYQEPLSGQWTLWDSSAYSQKNPQVTNSEGKFSFFVPPGQYHLEVKAKGHQTTISNIVNLTKHSPLVAAITVRSFPAIGPLKIPIPWIATQTIKVDFSFPDLPEQFKQDSLENLNLPTFSLKENTGKEVNSISLLGKPTLLSVFTTWSPTVSQQLTDLAELQKNSDLNIVPIAILEPPEKVAIYSRFSGYEFNYLTDQDGTTVNLLKLKTVPTHFLVNRRGVVKRVYVGVLSKQELLAFLTEL